jgi:HAD superfamily phosphoserine phosphatase-like hydrolase
MNAPQKIGAFFDLDGTLLTPPSLEWRFIGYLLERDEIGTVAAARWAAHSAKTFLSSGHGAVLANKYYLAGIHESVVGEWEKTIAPGSLPLLVDGIDHVYWRLERSHRVVLVTGTLAPLARAIARRLPCGAKVRATELEMEDGRFTGRVSGAHLSFEEKARVTREEAAACDLDLSQSFAYGNEMPDAKMLEAVGHPATVNASWRLKREGRKRGWTVYTWSDSYSWNDSREERKRPTNGALAPREAR